MSKRPTKTKTKTTTLPALPVSSVAEVPVLDPAMVVSMQETVERLLNAARWLESTASSIQERLRHVETWFLQHGVEVQLDGHPATGRVRYAARFK